MTSSGSSSSAPIAMPITWWPRTTSTDRPVIVRASIRTRSGWRPAAISASASYSASRMSDKLGPRCRSTMTSNITGPSIVGSYPRASSCSIQRGGIRPAGSPSMTRSTPSTILPAGRPGVRWRARPARRSRRSAEILMAFALRGAPCGYRPHPSVSVRACHAQQAPEPAHADHRESLLVDGMQVVLQREPHRIPLDRHRLGEADAVLPQVGLCLPRIPGTVHPGDRSEGRSPGSHPGLTRGLTGNLARRGRMLGRE